MPRRWASGLYLGDGRRRNAQSLGKTIETLAGLGLTNAVGGQPARPALVSVKHGVAADGEGNVYFSDSSNVGYQALTSQLRDFIAYANQEGLDFLLIVRSGTTLSGPLHALVDEGTVLLLRLL